MKALGAVNWTEGPKKWASRTKRSLPVWVWWAERKSQSLFTTSPGPVWKATSQILDPTDLMSWAIWSRYPMHLSPATIERLRHARTKLLDKNLEWLENVFAQLPESVRKRLRLRVGKGKRVDAIRGTAIRNGLTLIDWTQWVNKQVETRPFDPRTGEWTALVIVQQIVELMQKGDTQKARRAIHPCNFLVPKEWMKIVDYSLTWERWRQWINAKKVHFRRNAWLLDSRMSPSWLPKDSESREWAAVRGAGVVLLGLLRHSFEWPSIWNPTGQQRA